MSKDKMMPNDWVNSVDKEQEDDDLPNPVGYRMLIKPFEMEQVSKGGIILVDESKQYADIACQVGQVIKQGPDCYTGDKFSNQWCKVNDFVVFAKHAGQKLEIKQGDKTEKYLFINDDDVRAVAKDPARIRMYL